MGCIFSNLNSCSTTGTFRIVNFPIYKPVPKYLCAMSWRACQPACLGGHHIHCSIMATPHKFCVSLSDTCIALYGFKSIFLKQYKKYAPLPPPPLHAEAAFSIYGGCCQVYGDCYQLFWGCSQPLERLLSVLFRFFNIALMTQRTHVAEFLIFLSLNHPPIYRLHLLAFAPSY